MAKTNVGIDLQLNENTGSKTPNIVRNLEQIGEAGQKAGNKLTGAFGPEAQQNFDRFSQKVDQLYQRQIQGQSKSGAQAPATTQGTTPQVAQGRAGSQLEKYMYGGRDMTRAATGAIESLGKGDVAGAGASGGSMIAKLLKSNPALMAGTAIVGGTALGANALVNQWEPHVESSKKLAASIESISGTAEEQSETIRDAFSMAAGAAEEFGKSAEHGAALMKSLTREGVGTEEAARRTADQAYAYANEYGVNAQNLTRAIGLQERFAPDTNILGIAGGGLEASGMNRGRYEEFLQGMTSTVEAGLDQGVVRDPTAIAESMTRISAMGEQYTGARAAKLHQGMSQAFAGATGLGSESDMLMFRAAQGTVGEDGTYIDVMKQMEKGIGGGEMVQNLWKEIKGRTGDETEQTELLRSTLGLNYTHAENVREGLQEGNWEKVIELVEKAGREGGQTTDEKLLALQEKIKNDMSNAGQALAGVKVAALEGVEALTSGDIASNLSDIKDTVDIIADGVNPAGRAGETEESVKDHGGGTGRVDTRGMTAEEREQMANEARPEYWIEQFTDSTLKNIGNGRYGASKIETALKESIDREKNDGRSNTVLRQAIVEFAKTRESYIDSDKTPKQTEDFITALNGVTEALHNAAGLEVDVEIDTDPSSDSGGSGDMFGGKDPKNYRAGAR